MLVWVANYAPGAKLGLSGQLAALLPACGREHPSRLFNCQPMLGALALCMLPDHCPEANVCACASCTQLAVYTNRNRQGVCIQRRCALPVGVMWFVVSVCVWGGGRTGLGCSACCVCCVWVVAEKMHERFLVIRTFFHSVGCRTSLTPFGGNLLGCAVCWCVPRWRTLGGSGHVLAQGVGGGLIQPRGCPSPQCHMLLLQVGAQCVGLCRGNRISLFLAVMHNCTTSDESHHGSKQKLNHPEGPGQACAS